MKITIEPSQNTHGEPADCVPALVRIEHPYDDLALSDVIDLIKSALMAYGYNPSSVAEYFEAEEFKEE